MDALNGKFNAADLHRAVIDAAIFTTMRKARALLEHIKSLYDGTDDCPYPENIVDGVFTIRAEISDETLAGAGLAGVSIEAQAKLRDNLVTICGKYDGRKIVGVYAKETLDYDAPLYQYVGPSICSNYDIWAQAVAQKTAYPIIQSLR